MSLSHPCVDPTVVHHAACGLVLLSTLLLRHLLLQLLVCLLLHSQFTRQLTSTSGARVWCLLCLRHPLLYKQPYAPNMALVATAWNVSLLEQLKWCHNMGRKESKACLPTPPWDVEQPLAPAWCCCYAVPFCHSLGFGILSAPIQPLNPTCMSSGMTSMGLARRFLGRPHWSSSSSIFSTVGRWASSLKVWRQGHAGRQGGQVQAADSGKQCMEQWK